MENMTLATELLHELKLSARRWFIIAMVELIIILGIVGAFLWYVSLPVEETTEVEQTASERSLNIIGGDYNGGETTSY